MKKKKIDYASLLCERVYERVIMPRVFEMFLNKKPLMNSIELTEYLRENIDDFLNKEEKKQFIKSQFPVTDGLSDETINNKEVLKIALLLLSVEMINNIKQILKYKDF